MISIIIIVKNDRGIENTINKLVTIPKPTKYEILVIDASEGKIDDIKNKFPDVRWFYYHQPRLKKITLAEQRNLGVKEAKGNIVVFIDANCIPVNDWLNELYGSYRKYHDEIICGPILPSNKKVWNNLYNLYDKSEYRHECPTGNMMISKNVFERVGFFDENLCYGEDVDFTWRAVRAGFKIRFNSKAIVYHNWGDILEEITRSYKYGEARATLYKKHYDKWKSIIHHDKIAIAYALFIFGLPITLLFPLYPFFVIIPFIKNLNRWSLKMTIKLVVLNLINGLGILKGLLIN